MKVEGVEQLVARFRQLPDRLGRNAMRRAIRQGANVIRDDARNRAKQFDDPSTPESIAKNIMVSGGGRRMERRMGNNPVMRVGVRGGARKTEDEGKAPGGDTWYWRFVELGTERMPAKPFLRPAGSDNTSEVMRVTAQSARTQIERELNKMRLKK